MKPKKFTTRLETLPLNHRAKRVLTTNHIQTVGELAATPEKHLRLLHQLGPSTIAHIHDVLHDYMMS